MSSLIPLDGHAPAAFKGRQSSGMLDNARAGVQASFAVVGYKGRSWRLKHRGEETLLRDAQNRPMPELDVVIVGVAPSISKIYYARAYVEGDDSAPDCFSLDGVTPDAGAPKKQNPTCGNCAHNQWGSRITDAGKRAKSCQDSRRIAIVPLGDILNESLGGPMLLRIPPTSLPNLANYADFLSRKGADVPWVGTRLTFDPEVAYPKIDFTALGYLDEAQAADVLAAMESPLIDRLLNDAGPTASAAAPAADADIPGKPATVLRMPRRVASGGGGEPEPPPVQEPDPPPPPPEPEPEPEPEPAARGRVNPFAAATRPVQPAAAPKANGRGRPRGSAAQPPAAAPPDLESAIDDLLTDIPA
jgi:hypothetical protein